MTLWKAGPVELKFFNRVQPGDTHNIQTHTVDLTLLMEAQRRRQELAARGAFPDLLHPGLVTPPASKEKDGTPPPKGDEMPGSPVEH